MYLISIINVPNAHSTLTIIRSLILTSRLAGKFQKKIFFRIQLGNFGIEFFDAKKIDYLIPINTFFPYTYLINQHETPNIITEFDWVLSSE